MLENYPDLNQCISYRTAAIIVISISLIVNLCLYIQAQDLQDTIDDWANLGRYSIANSLLAPQVPVRVVFMGDSITDWWDFAEYFPGKPFVNRGIAGQTTPQMLVRFLPDVINLHPDVVVILGGTNDLANFTGYEPTPIIDGNLVSMVTLARANGITVILASILPVCGYHATQRPPELIREINAYTKNYCQQNGVIYLDYYSSLIGGDELLRPELSTDCVHLNEAGYNIMAPLAEEAVKKALAQRNKNLVGQ